MIRLNEQGTILGTGMPGNCTWGMHQVLRRKYALLGQARKKRDGRCFRATIMSCLVRAQRTFVPGNKFYFATIDSTTIIHQTSAISLTSYVRMKTSVSFDGLVIHDLRLL